VTIQMRKVDETKLPYILNVSMSHNADDFVNIIVKNLKALNITYTKDV